MLGKMRELGLESEVDNDYMKWAHTSAYLTAIFIGALNFYEVLQIISSKQSNYWSDSDNYIDIMAQGLVQSSSIVLMGSDTLEQTAITLYIAGLVMQFCKFYIN